MHVSGRSTYPWTSFAPPDTHTDKFVFQTDKFGGDVSIFNPGKLRIGAPKARLFECLVVRTLLVLETKEAIES